MRLAGFRAAGAIGSNRGGESVFSVPSFVACYAISRGRGCTDRKYSGDSSGTWSADQVFGIRIRQDCDTGRETRGGIGLRDAGVKKPRKSL